MTMADPMDIGPTMDLEAITDSDAGWVFEKAPKPPRPGTLVALAVDDYSHAVIYGEPSGWGDIATRCGVPGRIGQTLVRNAVQYHRQRIDAVVWKAIRKRWPLPSSEKP